jgi:hypothetical protein
MGKDYFKGLLEKYIEEGFPKVEFEVEGDKSIFFDADYYKYIFQNNTFLFGRNGVQTSINYRVIKAIVI